ncbi:MAG: DUF1800 domain-containing protein, partial [Myxococcales bacterium]
GWIQQQLSPGTIPDEAVDAKLAQLPTLTLTPAELLEAYPAPGRKKREEARGAEPRAADEAMALDAPKPRAITDELAAARLIRAVESRRQLQEVLVDFWFNHFNVSADKGAVRWLVTSYERDAIRPHVFGSFRALLGATARHPAMLFYLDNWLSAREGVVLTELPKKERRVLKRAGGQQPGLNENYARELLELHTLGVDGGYTQDDVREVARAFTGWSIERPREEGTFVFRDAIHDRDAKRVLGHHLPSGGGIEDGERVLDLLARHPSTARFIALKLCRKFVSDDPPKALVERVAKRFLETEGDLPSVYATIFSAREFWSEGARGSKTKTPFELAASSLRALGGTTDGGPALVRAVRSMGEPLYFCQP